MPMYRGKPFEARFCTEENKADIEAWNELNEARIGYYYTEYGAQWDNEEFLESFEEVPGSML